MREILDFLNMYRRIDQQELVYRDLVRVVCGRVVLVKQLIQSLPILKDSVWQCREDLSAHQVLDVIQTTVKIILAQPRMV